MVHDSIFSQSKNFIPELEKVVSTVVPASSFLSLPLYYDNLKCLDLSKVWGTETRKLLFKDPKKKRVPSEMQPMHFCFLPCSWTEGTCCDLIVIVLF